MQEFGRKFLFLITQFKFQEKHINIEEKLQALQNELEDSKLELNRVSSYILLSNFKEFTTFI